MKLQNSSMERPGLQGCALSEMYTTQNDVAKDCLARSYATVKAVKSSAIELALMDMGKKEN